MGFGEQKSRGRHAEMVRDYQLPEAPADLSTGRHLQFGLGRWQAYLFDSRPRLAIQPALTVECRRTSALGLRTSAFFRISALGFRIFDASRHVDTPARVPYILAPLYEP